ncbi:MAG: hypothetical protein LBL71_03435 [Endomicrobium sp.]|jgi:hypothetical protein|nr:hypothetical protein [Endomicrobium sp.]
MKKVMIVMLALWLCVSANAVVVPAKPRPQAAVRIVNNVEKKKDKSFLDTVLLITSAAIGFLGLDIVGSFIAFKIIDELKERRL